MSTWYCDIPEFHPQAFQVPATDNAETRTLMSIQNQREQQLETSNLAELPSAMRYALTENDAELDEFNTKYMFRTVSESLLSKMYFSKSNVRNVQRVIRFLVHRITGKVIDDQSVKELLIIMRSVFLQFGAHPRIIDENTPPREAEKLFPLYTKEVGRLNEIVFNYIVPRVVSGMQQYLDYLRDASQPPQHLELPQSDSVTGQRQYRSVTEVLTGSNL